MDRTSSIVLQPSEPYRKIAQTNWGLTNTQMLGMHVHHRIPQSKGGSNDPTNLYVCSPWFHYHIWHQGESYLKAIALQKRWKNGEFKTGFELSSSEQQSLRGRKGGSACVERKVGICSPRHSEKVSENMRKLVSTNKHWFQTEEHSRRTAQNNRVPYECPICGRTIRGKGPLSLHLNSHNKHHA